jgi:hypothetical protein
MELRYGDEVLDTKTGKSGRVHASIHRIREQIGWTVQVAGSRATFQISLPVDASRYQVTKPAPRTRAYPGADFQRLSLQYKASQVLQDIRPGQMIYGGEEELGRYHRRHDGGYIVITPEGHEFRYEAWELGEMAQEGKLNIREPLDSRGAVE